MPVRGVLDDRLGSSFRESTVMSAPRQDAVGRRVSDRSETMICVAPASRQTVMCSGPMGPAPMMTTVSPRRLVVVEPFEAQLSGSDSDSAVIGVPAFATGVPSVHGTLRDEAVLGQAAVDVVSKMSVLVQSCSLSRRQ